MKTFLSKFFQGDKVIWAIFAAFCLISIVEVYSAGSINTYKDGHFWSTFVKQTGMVSIGVVVAAMFSQLPVRYFRAVFIVYVISLFMLVYVMIWGTTINGGARWFTIPYIGLTVQPSELAKGALVGVIAMILTNSQTEKGATSQAFKNICYYSAPVVGLIASQNLSTAAMICFIVWLIMIVGRISTRLIVLSAGFAVSLAAAAYLTFAVLPSDPHDSLYDSRVTSRLPTWRARIFNSDMNTNVPPKQFVITDHNRQEVHARIAFARSNGVGRMPGKSVERDFLAQADSDFIYAIVAEETGFLGCTVVVLLYIFLMFRVGQIANSCKRNFPAFFIMGLAILMVTQAMFNMLVAVGIFPVTGQTLPMISRGGSSTLITCAYFGIILSVSRYVEERKKTEQLQTAEPAVAEVVQ